MGFGLFPQAELFLYKPVIAGFSPVDFGVAARGHVGMLFDVGSSNSDAIIPIGVGALGTMHFGFKGFNFHFSEFNDTPIIIFDYLSRFDWFMELGIAFDVNINTVGDPLGIAAVTGLNYFVKDNFMLTSSYTYWNGLSGFSIGGSYKIGPSQKTKDVSIDLDLY